MNSIRNEVFDSREQIRFLTVNIENKKATSERK